MVMVILDDALISAITYDITEPLLSPDRCVHRELRHKLGNQEYADAALAPVAEVQKVTPGDRTGGTFDLTCAASNGHPPFSVFDLDWNATKLEVQKAMDAAALVANPNYQIGDIELSFGPFGDGGLDTYFAFAGPTVRGNHSLITVDGTNLTGGTTDPVASEIVSGVAPRFWFAVLKALSVIKGTDPSLGDTPAGQYSVNARDGLENYPSNSTIRTMLIEASAQEGQDWLGELGPLLGFQS